ncbi:uncharacterized protein LOC129725239 [Wyeomyia smithii]|uniref:uncharacterized protein LOC129725239 n=1 Tax=Wyeomyia smithii TaxID=174621 RepID=UPI002467D750|nr:uncharacterized protein LOC129725239 [Wyeomyia smithii]
MAGCTEWCERSQKNKMQTNTLLSGITTLIMCGFFVGSSIFNVHLRYQTWTLGESDSVLLMIVNLFYIAAVLGSVTGAFLIARYEKVFLSRIYLLMLAIASILSLIVPTDLVAAAFSRVFAGFAYGMAYLAVLIHGGEVLVKEFRGLVIACINHVLFFGILAHGAVSPLALTDTNLESTRIIGIIGIMVTLLATLIGQFMTYESPIFLVQKGRDAEAIRSLMKLRLESVETIEIREAYIDIKVMLQEDSHVSRSILADGNWRPLLLLCLGKLAAVLSFNAALNQVQLTVVDFLYDMPYYSIWGAVILSIRMLGGLIFVYTVDIFGRKPQQVLSAFLCGAMLIAMGIVYLAVDSVDRKVGGSLFLVYALLTCTGVTLVPDVHQSEAFPTSKKAASIVVVQLVESAAQVLFLSVTFTWDFNDNAIYGGILLTCGIPLVIIAVLFFILLPETMNLTLRQSRAVFARNPTAYETPLDGKESPHY